MGYFWVSLSEMCLILLICLFMNFDLGLSKFRFWWAWCALICTYKRISINYKHISKKKCMTFFKHTIFVFENP